MSIQSLPNGGHKVRWTTPDGRHPSKNFKKGQKKLAEAFEDEVNRGKRLGYLPQLEGGKKTIEDVALAWWATKNGGLAPRTAELYEQLLGNHILPYLGSARLHELTAGDVEAWLARLKTGPTAKRNALGLLTRIYNFAMRSGDAHGNPCLVAEKPKLPAREPIRVPSLIEIETIRKRLLEMDRLGDACLVSAIAYAGLRPSHEIIPLDWSHIKGKTILARSSKTGKHRAVKILGPLARDLAEWKLNRKHSEIVFPTSTGKRFTKDTYDNWRNRIWHNPPSKEQRKRGITKVEGVAPVDMRPYDLRHAFVSLLLADPAKSRVYAAEQAGHSLQVQSDRYAHIMAEGTAGDAEQRIRNARAEVFGVELEETG